MKKTLSQLAELVGGEVVGDPSLELEGISSLQLAGPREITFITHQRYAEALKATRAGAVIVPSRELAEGRPGIVVGSPYLAYARIAAVFHPPSTTHQGVAREAFVHPEAEIGEKANIYPLVWVDRGASIGRRTTLYPGVFVGESCRIGEDCVIYANAVLYPGCILGNRVIIHAGSVIGSDGFGYARDGSRWVKIPQLGSVRIDDDVEIGANSCVDRSSFGETWIQRGVKTDNLVQIGHNATIGEDSILSGQVGLAGSVQIGKNVVLAGQVGVADHVQIAENAMVGAKSGVAQSVPKGEAVSGIPSISHRQWLRSSQVFTRLPDLLKRLRALEKRVEGLEGDRDANEKV